MTRVTRRSALGQILLGAGVAGVVGGCATTPVDAAAYPGKAAFLHGVASGDPTREGLVIWTRVTLEKPGVVPVAWTVARDPNFKDVAQKGVVLTGPDRDYTVKVDVARLEPDSAYYYAFRIGQTVSPGGAARTLPSAGLADFRLALVARSDGSAGFFNVYRELATRGDVDLVLHLGDYLNSDGPGGVGANVDKALDRAVGPAQACSTLDDFRGRYGQYRRDPDLQAAHAIAPWISLFDDRAAFKRAQTLSSQPSSSGPEADPERLIGAAIQAYFEWMPTREPAPGRPREALFRNVDIGDLASLHLLETRLSGRSAPVDVSALTLAPESKKSGVAAALGARIGDVNRRMMSPEEEAWLAEGLLASTATGKKWQVIANPSVLAKAKSPDLKKALKPDVFTRLSASERQRSERARWGLEWDLEGWGGAPSARERLFAAARAAKARLVVASADSAAWANELHDGRKQRWGVEFVCPSVAALGDAPGADAEAVVKDLGWLMPEANDEVVYFNAAACGFTLLTLAADRVKGEFIRVSTVRTREYRASTDAAFFARAGEIGMDQLQRPLGASSIIKG